MPQVVLAQSLSLSSCTITETAVQIARKNVLLGELIQVSTSAKREIVYIPYLRMYTLAGPAKIDGRI